MKRQFLLGLIGGSAVVLCLQYGMIGNITRPLGLLHGDAYLLYYLLNHWMHVFTGSAWAGMTTLPMFWGFSGSLFFTDHHALAAVSALPIYLLTRDIITTSNLVVVATIVFSFVSMYTFIWFVTKRADAGLLSGLLYVLNPYVFSRYPDQLNLLSLQWIPLIFLFVERSLHRRTVLDPFLFFMVLTAQLLTSLNYSVMLTVILPVYFGIRWYQERFPLRRFMTRGGVIGAVIFISCVVLSAYSYQRVYTRYPLNRTQETAAVYAARPTDWLFAPETNLLYGSFKPWAAERFPGIVRMGIYSEHNLYPGLILLMVTVIGCITTLRTTERRYRTASVILIAVSFILSFGPTIHLSESVAMPSLYRLVYMADPVLRYVRATPRFAAFAVFFMSWIAGMTWVAIRSRFRPRAAIVLFASIVAFAVIENLYKPPEFLDIPPEMRSVYQVLDTRADIRVVLEYPIGNLISYIYPEARAEDLDAHYLLWATKLHTKNLFNGYSGFLPAGYYTRANYLSVNFPTDEKLGKLREWGVDAIILHRDEFPVQETYRRIRNALLERGVPVIAESSEEIAFDLLKWSDTGR